MTRISRNRINLEDGRVDNAFLQDYGETLVSDSDANGTFDLDLTTGNVFDIVLTGATTFTFSNPPASGTHGAFTLILSQDGGAPYTVTWPGSVLWPGGTEPTLTGVEDATDILTFSTYDGGTTWFGVVAGQDMQEPSVVIFTRTLDSDAATSADLSMRQSCGSLSAGGTRARVRFEAPASGTFFCDNAGIGVRTGTGFSTVATPIELLFAGLSGFTIANGAQITSDWATLTFADTDTLIVIMDIGGASTTLTLAESGAGALAVGDSYNVASDAGFTANNFRRSINQIEA